MEQKQELVRLDEDEMVRGITIILAAYSENFPQLRGKAVRPDHRDDARRYFARLLVEKLRLSGIQFFRPVREPQASSTSKWFGPDEP